MGRKIKIFPALAILILIAFGCSKDEESKPVLDSFIGEWEAFTYAAVGAGNWQYIHTLVLKEDGTFTYHRLELFEEQRINFNSSGTYSVQGDKIVLHHLEPVDTTAEYYYEFTTTSVILTSTTIPSDVKEYELQS